MEVYRSDVFGSGARPRGAEPAGLDAVVACSFVPDARSATPYHGTVTTGAPKAARLTRLVGLALAAALALGIPVATPAQADDAVKLTVAMTSLTTTGTSPTDQVTARFTLTNTGTVPAYGVVAHLWRSQDPIHDQLSLQTAAAGGSTWGGWVSNGYYVVARATTAFQPGASRQFSITATMAQLGFVKTGVAYAFGADVVATADQSSNNSVVAKIRTVIPMPGKARVPVTSAVLLTTTPTKLGPNVFANDDLTAQLTGPLSALLTAAARPGMSWLIDPALLDEVRDQADGYHVFNGSQLVPGAGQQVAADWLSRFTRLNSAHGGRTLFANPDTLGAQNRKVSDLVDWSHEATSTVDGVDDLPLVIVPTGKVATTSTLKFLSSAGADAIVATNSRTAGALQSTSSTPILGTTVFPQEPASTDPTLAITQRQLALAQTVICGKAGQFRLLTSAQDVAASAASMPEWTTQRSLGELLSATPSRQADLLATKVTQLSKQQFSELNRLAADIDAYDDLVPASVLTGEREGAYLRGISTAWLGHQAASDRYDDAMLQLIGRSAVSSRVRLSISGRLVMSARSNQFPVTVTNNSLETIRVRVVITTDNPQRLSVPPSDLITVDPGQSQTVNVRPEASANGLVQADAHLVTASGRRVGDDVPVTIEVTDLGVVAWIIVAVSAVVLVGATAWRIRQVRRRDSQKAASESAEQAAPAQSTDQPNNVSTTTGES